MNRHPTLNPDDDHSETDSLEEAWRFNDDHEPIPVTCQGCQHCGQPPFMYPCQMQGCPYQWAGTEGEAKE